MSKQNLSEIENRLLNVDATAIYLGMSPAQVRRWANEGKIKIVEMDKGMKFDREYLDEWIKSKLIKLGKSITITIGNQKGGVGKTTLSMNIGYELASRGYKVLIVDLDPQQSLSSQFEKHGSTSKNIYTLYQEYLNNEKIKTHLSAIPTGDYPGGHENLFLIAGDDRFMEIQNTLNGHYLGMRSLENLLKEIKNDYDFIFLDTPPSRLDTIIQAALIASDYVLVPQSPDKMSTEAMHKYLNIINHIKQSDNMNLQVLGSVVTKHKPNTDAHNYMIKKIKEVYSLFNTKIDDRIQVHEAQIAKRPMALYNNGYEIAEQYRSLADELIEKLQSFGEKI